MKLKAVIIDDEADSREILAGYLRRYCPDVEVCGTGESVSTGLAAIKAHFGSPPREFCVVSFALPRAFRRQQPLGPSLIAD